jgi:hypothetical protein
MSANHSGGKVSSLKDPITTKLMPLVQIKTNLRVGSSFVSVGVVASTNSTNTYMP